MKRKSYKWTNNTAAVRLAAEISARAEAAKKAAAKAGGAA
jgi:hypothetical protein